jgi:hypothetical protein
MHLIKRGFVAFLVIFNVFIYDLDASNGYPTLPDTLSATMSGGGQICQNGGGTNLVITFTGDGPYTFVYGVLVSGVPQPQPAIVTTSNPLLIPVNPTLGTFYLPLSVSNASASGNVWGQAAVFVFNPSTAVMTGSASFCDSVDTEISIDFTGTGPFNIFYTKDGLPQPVISTFEDPFFLPVLTDTTTTFVLTGVESPGCVGNAIGDATITVRYTPTYSELSFDCDPVAEQYVLSFDVTSFVPPLSLVSGAGSFSGFHFTSSPTPADSLFKIVFHDGGMCGDVVISGGAECSCLTDAGVLDTIPKIVCPGSSLGFSGDFSTGFILDANDTLQYALVTDSTSAWKQHIIAWSDQFYFPSAPQNTVYDTFVYFVVAVAGNHVGGTLDLTDPCLDLSNFVPVMYRSNPEGSWGSLSGVDTNGNACLGDTVRVCVLLSGLPPFKLSYNLNGLDIHLNGIQSHKVEIPVVLSGQSHLKLVSLSDRFCAGSVTAEEIGLDVNPPPFITNLTAECGYYQSFYTVSFDAVGMPPFSVAGLSGTFIGNRFSSAPILAGAPYNIMLNDSNLCGIDTASGIEACPCLTRAGDLTQGMINLCYGDTYTGQFPTNIHLESGDSIYCVLIRAGSNDVVAYSDAAGNGASFAFGGSLQAGMAYQLAFFAGKNIQGALPDLTHPCLSIATGEIIMWDSPVSALMVGDTIVCASNPGSVSVQCAGDPPFVLFYLENGLGVWRNGLNVGTNNFMVNGTTTTTFTPVSITNLHGCLGTVSGVGQVLVSAVPEIENLIKQCDYDTDRYRIHFGVSNGTQENTPYTVSGIAGIFSDTLFTSNYQLNAYPYTVVIASADGCTATTSGISECVCPTFSGSLDTSAISICLPASQLEVPYLMNNSLDTGDIQRFILCTSASQLPLGVLASSGTPVFTNPEVLVPESWYEVVAVAGNDDGSGNILWSDPCLSVSAPLRVRVLSPPEVFLPEDTTLCKGGVAEFNLQFSGKPPFIVNYQLDGNTLPVLISNDYTFNLTSQNVQSRQAFTLTGLIDAQCPGFVSDTMVIAVYPTPFLTLSGDTTLCEGGAANLAFYGTGGSIFDVNLQWGGSLEKFNGLKSGETRILNFPVGSDSVSYFKILGFEIPENDCPVEVGDSVVVRVDRPTVQLSGSSDAGFGVTCTGDTDGYIVAIASGIPPFVYTWNGGLSGDTISGVGAGNFLVTVTDQIGCTATSTYTITEPPRLKASAEGFDPWCAGGVGQIFLSAIEGGVGPFVAGIEPGGLFLADTLPMLLGELAKGAYNMVVEDSKGCSIDTLVILSDPPELALELGPDLVVELGDSIRVAVMVIGGTPPYTWNWKGGRISMGVLLDTPSNPTEYVVTITDANGCQTVDAVAVSISVNQQAYIPNVINKHEAENSKLTVYAGKQVTKVEYFNVFDRWGGVVYANTNFLPNDPAQGWDGRNANPGVYVYMVSLLLRDGSTRFLIGDVTLLP